MKHRLKALERRLLRHGVARRICVVGDGERWRETVFDYSSNVELASMLWASFSSPILTSAQLERWEAQGVQISRLRVPAVSSSMDQSMEQGVQISRLRAPPAPSAEERLS